VDTFDHDWPVPCLPNPFEIVPSHNGLLKSSGDVGIQHRPFSWDDDILKFHQAAVREKSRQPAWPNEKLIHKRQHWSQFSTKKFFRAIAKVAFPETCDRRVNGDHQGRKPGLARAIDTPQSTVATADEIKLVPDRPSRCGCDVFEPTPRKCRKRRNDSCFAGSARGRFFTAWKHQPTAPNGREDQRHGHRSAEHGRPQIAHRRCDRAARPQCHRFECPAVCAQRRFALSAAIDVIEHHARKSSLRRAAQIVNVENARRLNRLRPGIHVSRKLTSVFINTGLQAGATARQRAKPFQRFSFRKGKPLKRLGLGTSNNTRLKPGAN
jgi:hypothetical protein